MFVISTDTNGCGLYMNKARLSVSQIFVTVTKLFFWRVNKSYQLQVAQVTISFHNNKEQIVDAAVLSKVSRLKTRPHLTVAVTVDATSTPTTQNQLRRTKERSYPEPRSRVICSKTSTQRVMWVPFRRDVSWGGNLGR